MRTETAISSPSSPLRPLRARRARGGFTLAEMIVAMAIMSMLVGAMGSAVVLASRAMPDPNDLSRQLASAHEAVARIEVDLLETLTFDEAEPGAMTIAVPDRGYDAAGDESIRYAWSGVVGDPLTLSLNGQPAAELCDNVHAFTIAYEREAMPLESTPKVLMAIESVPTSRSQTRIDQLESWGFQIETMSTLTPTGDIPGLIEQADVVYITRSLMYEYSAFESKMDAIDAWDSVRGVVSDQPYWTFKFYKLATGSTSWTSTTSIIIDDATHPITNHVPVGPLTVYSSSQDSARVNWPWAPGLRVLSWASGKPALALVDLDDELMDGSAARGRRVVLPYDGFTFNPEKVNDDGWTLVRRALVWAGAPVRYTAVTITLQVGPDPSDAITRRVNLYNTPGAI